MIIPLKTKKSVSQKGFVTVTVIKRALLFLIPWFSNISWTGKWNLSCHRIIES